MKKISFVIATLISTALLVNCDNQTIEHFVTFDTKGGSHIETQRVKDGEKAVKPEDPERGVDHFKGWSTEENSPYTFDEIVTSDITLYADWEKAPESYHFTFIGHNCFLRGMHIYETNIVVGASEHFEITLEEDYSLPLDVHVVQGDNVSYDKKEGVITISEMTSDVEIIADAVPFQYYTFSFSGVNCKIYGSETYTESVKRGEYRQYTILPNPGYILPTSITLPDFATYKDGNIIINSMDGDIELENIVAPAEEIKYSINFNGENCKAKSEGMKEYAHSFQIMRSDQDTTDLVLTLALDDEKYAVPTSIEILFDNVPGTQPHDYSYDIAKQTITIKKMANVLINVKAFRPEEETCTLTLDAGEGATFFTGEQKLSFEVKPNSNLIPVIRAVEAPTLTNNLFGYYTYSDGALLTYFDTITADVTLKANYFNVSKPYEDLDQIASSEAERWKTIKAVAITNPNPEKCFAIGATKTTKLYNLVHKLRIIDYQHDTLSGNHSLTAGITFEFANVVTKDGSGIGTHWAENNNNEYIYSTVCGQVNGAYNNFETNLKNSIVRVQKIYMRGQHSSRVATPFDTYAFLLGLSEIDDFKTYGEEGYRYQYYKNPDYYTYCKTIVGGDEETIYWLRTPDNYTEVKASTVYYDGPGLMQGINEWDNCFSPVFCL